MATSGLCWLTAGAAPALAAPALSLNPALLELPAQEQGMLGPARTVTVTSSGDAALVVTSATVVGADAQDFLKTDDSCSGESVAPGQTCTVRVRFNPTAAGERAASPRIRSNRPGTDALLPLEGEGLPAAAAPQPPPPTQPATSALLGANTNFAVGSFPQAVAVADLNGDGRPDLATANFSPDNVSVLLGTGTGSFGAHTPFAVGDGPHSVAIGDLNDDGHPDLATANLNSHNVSVLLGTGTGSFGPQTNFAVGARPASVAIADLNGDGRLDLATANSDSHNVSVRLGTGTGSFAPGTLFAVGTGPSALAIGI